MDDINKRFDKNEIKYGYRPNVAYLYGQAEQVINHFKLERGTIEYASFHDVLFLLEQYMLEGMESQEPNKVINEICKKPKAIA